VIIDDAPTSPNQKQETWALLVTILPMFAQMLTPEVVVMILDYSPLPSRLIESLKGLLQKAPDPVAAQTAQAQLAAIQAAVAQQQAQAAKDHATAQRTIAGIGLDQAKAHELMAKAATAGQGKELTPPPAPTEKDAAETDRIRAQTILALAQAAGVVGDTAATHAKRDLLASEIDAHMNTPLGGGAPRQTPTEGPGAPDLVGRLGLPVLGQPHMGSSAVAPAVGGHMSPINPLQGPQPLGGPLSGLSHLSPELLAHLAQLTGAGVPPPA